MIYGESFNKIFSAIERIERHIGLLFYTDDETVNGRLNNIETSSQEINITPYCEIDVPIVGDSFETSNTPVLIGDSWIVNNSVFITVDQGNSSVKTVHEWGDVEFNGNIGTLMGANGQYDGKSLTVTYFYRDAVLYYGIVFNNGYPETRKIENDFLNLVIKDDVLQNNQKIFIDSKGRVGSYQVQEDATGNNHFVDISNGQTYEIYAENGSINWRTI